MFTATETNLLANTGFKAHKGIMRYARGNEVYIVAKKGQGFEMYDICRSLKFSGTIDSAIRFALGVTS